MVGFGSSLRLARRPGWEGAYLDYETLKLLLSQIEAVYEEEKHSRMSRENSMHVWDLDYLEHQLSSTGHAKRKARNKRSDKHKQRGRHVRDYKDELFLESDSEAAFLSVDDDDFSTTEEGEGSDFEPHPTGQHPAVAKPFAFTHSAGSSSDGDGEDDQDVLNGCLPSFGGSNVMYRRGNDPSAGNGGGKRKVRNRKKKPTIPMKRTEGVEEDTFYSVAAATNNTFYMSGGDPEDLSALTPTRANLPSTTMDYSGSLQYFPPSTNCNETTSLLPSTTATTSPSPSLFTFFTQNNDGGVHSLTPQTFQGQTTWHSKRGSDFSSNRMNTDYRNQATASGESSPNHTYFFSGAQPQPHSHHLQQPTLQGMQPQAQPQSSSTTQQQQQQQPPSSSMNARRKREQLSRRQKQRNRRAKRGRKVPRHLRIAHSKARAITERFLGLLRAETEKVLLFAQSRLGELADTAGSLRFPSFDEEYASNAYNSANARNGTARAGASFEFGDGGLHPSASSSSDDAGGFGGGQRWTDSSDDSSNAVEKKTSTTSSKRRTGGNNHSSRLAGISSLPNTVAGSGDRLSEDTGQTRSEIDDALQSRTARSRDIENIQVVRRQIAHFEALRKNRAVFARNDQILGEDMLFLSAVEEADGYTAVGVELIHVLKYICVNLIAVRKICRKHDRLLMNRMLGGYYQRIRTSGDAQTAYSRDIEGTLGGPVAQVSGDIYEAHPVLIGHMSHYKLVGVYDKKIQKLANSRTVQVVSSCLALSLSEYEVARSRADALTRLNSTTSVGNSIDDFVPSVEDPPSTASSISLTRLRYTVMSIFALREASRTKADQFTSYIARYMLTFSGQPVVGEGLDGCSRETLDFLVAYNPDMALLLDSAVLYDGLKQSKWSRLPISTVMVSVLAAATFPESVAHDVLAPFLAREEKIVANAVSIVPESKSIYWKGLTMGQLPRVPGRRSIAIEEVPPCILDLSRMSLFLFMVSANFDSRFVAFPQLHSRLSLSLLKMNYFVSHATSYIFTRSVSEPSQCAAITGVPNISAILVAMLHCGVAFREFSASSRCRFGTKSIRMLMLLSSMMGVAGTCENRCRIERNGSACFLKAHSSQSPSSTYILYSKSHPFFHFRQCLARVCNQ